MTATGGRVRYPRVLANPEFRKLWIGQSVSTVGDRLVLVAIPLYVTQLTGSARDLGIVLASYTIPFVAVILVGGVLADRLPRQRLMIAADLARAATYGAVSVIAFASHAPVAVLAALLAVAGVGEAFFRPAYTGLVPQTVPEHELQQAQAMNGWSLQAASLVGPALATALVVGLGAGTAFAFDAVSFLVSVWFLARVHPRPRGEPAERTTMLAELGAGWREVVSRQWIWVTVAIAALTLMIAVAPWFVLGPLVAKHQYGHASIYGVLATAYGVGTVTGAVIGLRWRPSRPLVAAFVLLFLDPLQLVCFGLGAPLVVAALAAVGAGVAIALFIIIWETTLAERVPPQALSRVSAFDWMGSYGLTPVGYLLAGALATTVAPQHLLLWCAGITAVLVALGLAPRETRELRRIEYAGAQRP